MAKRLFIFSRINSIHNETSNICEFQHKCSCEHNQIDNSKLESEGIYHGCGLHNSNSNEVANSLVNKISNKISAEDDVLLMFHIKLNSDEISTFLENKFTTNNETYKTQVRSITIRPFSSQNPPDDYAKVIDFYNSVLNGESTEKIEDCRKKVIEAYVKNSLELNIVLEFLYDCLVKSPKEADFEKLKDDAPHIDINISELLKIIKGEPYSETYISSLNDLRDKLLEKI